ncbi:MAG: hypothetical protein J0L99_01020 [Chitinophagales bacterium]|nr:hypothetical protein [Chitinophagales bacterium]
MKNRIKSIFLFCLPLMAWQLAPADYIPFRNASFEGKPKQSAAPADWNWQSKGSTADIMPGAWGVQCTPKAGKTCLGLVTREDGTVEDIGQQLDKPLKGGICYKFSIHLAHVEKYAGYNMPVRLRVWGGNGHKSQLLAASGLVNHKEWRQYNFQFVPDSDLNTIIFEAYYAPGVTFRYKGNILLDECSPIERCDRA